jgi:hypothetical protein
MTRPPLARSIQVLALALGAGCDDGSNALTGPLTLDGTVDSLSPGSTGAPTVLSLEWYYDEGLGDTSESGAARPVPVTLPAKFGLTINEPTRYILDFDATRALPSCADPAATRCWDEDKPRYKGKGKLALGTFIAFEDADGNGQYTQKPQAELVRGHGPLYLIYAKDMDEQAMKEFGELKLVNPGALRPGFNFVRVRCKNQVGWTKSSFDPFEVVPAGSITVESMEVFRMRQKTGELCTNWT